MQRQFIHRVRPVHSIAVVVNRSLFFRVENRSAVVPERVVYLARQPSFTRQWLVNSRLDIGLLQARSDQNNEFAEARRQTRVVT